MRARLLLLAAAVALAACAPMPSGAGTGAARTLKFGSVTGKVVAPSGWKAGDKAPATAVDVAKKFALTATATAEAVGNVEVWLGTPKRERFKGPTVATTSAKGEFVIKNVPKDLSYVVYASVVNAKGEVTTSEVQGEKPASPPPPPPPAQFCAVAPQQPVNKPARPITISFASTVVVQDLLKDVGNQLGKIDWDAYGKAVAAVDAKLDFNALPDLNDAQSITNFLGTVEVDGKAISASLDALKTQIKATGVSAQDVQAVLNGLPTLNVTGSGAVSQDGQTVAAGGGEGTIVVPQGIDLSGLLGEDPAPAASPTASPAATPAP